MVHNSLSCKCKKCPYKELERQQRVWASWDGLNVNHWDDSMTWEQMQNDRYAQLGYAKYPPYSSSLLNKTNL